MATTRTLICCPASPVQDPEVQHCAVETKSESQPDHAGAGLGDAVLLLLAEPEAQRPGIAVVVVLPREAPLEAATARDGLGCLQAPFEG